MFIRKNKILYKDWIYNWLIEKKEYIKESTYANYSKDIKTIQIFDKYVKILRNG